MQLSCSLKSCSLPPLTYVLLTVKCSTGFHSGQTHDACAVPATILREKIEINVESFTLTTKLNAISENLSFLLWECIQNEFYRREIWFIGALYVSSSHELRARKSLNWFKLQGYEKPEMALFFSLRLTALNNRVSLVSRQIAHYVRVCLWEGWALLDLTDT